jgi:hypothetical protein
MDEVNQRLANRRKYFASTTQLTFNLDDNQDSKMTSFNSKVDLRPQWMIKDNNAHIGKPHVDAVLQPEQRNLGIPRTIPGLSPDQLQNVTLRPTGIRHSIDAEGLRTTSNSLDNYIVRPVAMAQPTIDVFRYQTETRSSNSRPEPSIPPPPPMPMKSATFPQTGTVHEQQHVNDVIANIRATKEKFNETSAPATFKESAAIESLQRKIEEMELKLQLQFSDGNYKMSQTASEILPSYTPGVPAESVRTVTKLPTLEASDDVDITRRFNEKELGNVNTREWINSLVTDQFERMSRIDTYNKGETEPNAKDWRRPRSKDRDQSRDASQKRDASRESKASRRSYVSRASSLGSAKSAAKSIRSVLFKRTEEEELCSEIDEDDVADVNTGDTGFIDFTSDKFTIHGPFVDKELNVFHAICVEFQLAARISFAKRTAFSRTNPAHERVYALLGSNRRSSWTNRNNWTKATNNLQVLDFIFRKVIRSESKRIRQPVMELEHFTENSTLDSRRFWKIMRSIFKKREHLTTVLGVNVDRFDDIK